MGNQQSQPFTTTSACLSAATAALMGMKMMARDPADISAPSINNNAAAALFPRTLQCNITPRDPPPTPFYCGNGGRLLQPSELTVVNNVTSVNNCATACFKYKGCISFAYTNASQNCRLLSKVLIAQDYVRRTAATGTVHFNHHCFHRTCIDVNTCQSIIYTSPGSSYNDNYWTQTLPFPVSAYGVSSSSIDISSNGWVGLQDNAFGVNHQPSSALPDHSETPIGQGLSTAILPFWTDQTINGVNDFSQIIALESRGVAPNRQLKIVWKTVSNDQTQSYSYSANYAENTPGVWTVGFNQFTGPSGNNAVIGIEGNGNTQYYNWEYQPSGTPFTVPALPFNITFNTNDNTAAPSGPS